MITVSTPSRDVPTAVMVAVVQAALLPAVAATIRAGGWWWLLFAALSLLQATLAYGLADALQLKHRTTNSDESEGATP